VHADLEHRCAVVVRRCLGALPFEQPNDRDHDEPCPDRDYAGAWIEDEHSCPAAAQHAGALARSLGPW
jgi:hypothetical protein